ncbi:MAG: cellulase family glycosylhydrolase [Solirubrobacteraceae bacterium]
MLHGVRLTAARNVWLRLVVTRTVALAFGLAVLALTTSPAPPAFARGTGFVHINGARLIGIDGKTLRLIGVNRSGTEYACAGPVNGGGFGYGVFVGPTDDRSIRAMLTWDVNSVALPLNEACWLGGYAGLNPGFTGSRYRRAIVRYVQRLNHFGIYAVLRLSGAAPGQRAYGSDTTSSDEAPMADADHSLAFWSSVAATFRSYKMVLFHTFDEPHDIDWACILLGCIATDAPNGRSRFGSYQTVGNQAMVNAIRAAGAPQPIIISGPEFAGDLSGWEQYMPSDPRHQLGADVSSFDYADYVLAHKHALRAFARRHPVIVGGFGDTHCTSTYSRKVMAVIDSIHQSYFAWTWNTVQDYGGCSNNALLDDPGPQINGQPAGYYTARPSGFGSGVRDHYRAINAHHRY